MIMSTILSGKRYTRREYAIVLLVCCGVFLFLTGSESRERQRNADSPSLASVDRRVSLLDGLLILALYLTFDSFTSNWQEKMTRSYHVSPLHMMAFVNLFSILLTSTSLLQQSHLIPSLTRVLSCWELSCDCLLMSLASATGQLLIFYTISAFGALAFTFIMTLRQVLAICLSCLMYGHSLSWSAVVGVVCVFLGLFAQIYLKARKQASR